MTLFLSQYIYLGSLLFWMAIHAVSCIAFPSQRRPILTSSLFAVPQAAFALLYVPQYWNPRYIVNLLIGLENFVFCFLAGGLAWMAAVWAFHRRISFSYRIPLILKRFSLCSLIGILMGALFYFIGFRGYAVSLLIMLIWGLILLIWRKNYSKLMVCGALTFTILFVFIFKSVEIVWPNLLSLWNLKNLCGLGLGHIPLEEIAWAFFYGAVWPITVAWLLDARLEAKKPSV
jgi:hypothetical protein